MAPQNIRTEKIPNDYFDLILLMKAQRPKAGSGKCKVKGGPGEEGLLGWPTEPREGVSLGPLLRKVMKMQEKEKYYKLLSELQKLFGTGQET